MDDIIAKVSAFLMEALQSWLHFQYYQSGNNEQILQQMLWFNSNIQIGGN